MNTVGKIFVGVIALMSVVVLTVSAMSYASHHDWKKKHDDLNAQLQQVNADKTKLEGQKKELQDKVASESQTYLSAIEALKTKADALEAQNIELAKANEDLQKEISDRLGVLESNDQQINDLRRELATATTNLAEAQQVRAAFLQQLAQTVERVHTLSLLNGDLKEQNEALQKEYDNALAILNKNGMSSNPADYGDKPKFAVQGTIEEVNSGDDGILQISIGSDDGLAPSNQLDVKRGDSYIGKIEVVSVEPRRAICKTLPDYRQGVIMKGDDVYAQ